jgi:hypothetical protein
MTDFTRRKMLGATVGTMAGAVAAAGSIEPALADDAVDLDLFVKVSVALTGVAEAKLAPTVDPIKVKLVYFKQAKSDPGFAGLMDIVHNAQSPAAAAQSIMTSADPGIKFLGRSIILAWYLGAWYPPQVLNRPPPSKPVPPDKIISDTAYTQGWTWSIAQSHPMGYSDLRFGHWSDPPLPLDTLIKA